MQAGPDQEGPCSSVRKKPAQMGNGMECSMHMDFKDKTQDFKEILCCEVILVRMGCNHS